MTAHAPRGRREAKGGDEPQRPAEPHEHSVAAAGQGQASPGEDVVLVRGASEDGQALAVLRKRGDRIEPGIARALQPGKPIMGEVVRLKPRPGFPLLCDVEVELEAPGGKPTERRSASGPARVASDAYRRNWDAIWQRGGSGDPALN